ncbi:hypothetical protein ACH5RR_024565 [Cinchona calisaya]|uniref:Uncharacterized protein n=1 Tax=Cinchona calisaya TaxID=153742 RepID=A0ABD2Z248_9GENT
MVIAANSEYPRRTPVVSSGEILGDGMSRVANFVRSSLGHVGLNKSFAGIYHGTSSMRSFQDRLLKIWAEGKDGASHPALIEAETLRTAKIQARSIGWERLSFWSSNKYIIQKIQDRNNEDKLTTLLDDIIHLSEIIDMDVDPFIAIRIYTVRERQHEIVREDRDDGSVYRFGNECFPADMLTSYHYYPVETLVHLVNTIHLNDHQYQFDALKVDISSVSLVDRQPLINYFTGKTPSPFVTLSEYSKLHRSYRLLLILFFILVILFPAVTAYYCKLFKF